MFLAIWGFIVRVLRLNLKTGNYVHDRIDYYIGRLRLLNLRIWLRNEPRVVKLIETLERYDKRKEEIVNGHNNGSST